MGFVVELAGSVVHIIATSAPFPALKTMSKRCSRFCMLLLISNRHQILCIAAPSVDVIRRDPCTLGHWRVHIKGSESSFGDALLLSALQCRWARQPIQKQTDADKLRLLM